MFASKNIWNLKFSNTISYICIISYTINVNQYLSCSILRKLDSNCDIFTDITAFDCYLHVRINFRHGEVNRGAISRIIIITSIFNNCCLIASRQVINSKFGYCTIDRLSVCFSINLNSDVSRCTFRNTNHNSITVNNYNIQWSILLRNAYSSVNYCFCAVFIARNSNFSLMHTRSCIFKINDSLTTDNFTSVVFTINLNGHSAGCAFRNFNDNSSVTLICDLDYIIAVLFGHFKCCRVA